MKGNWTRGSNHGRYAPVQIRSVVGISKSRLHDMELKTGSESTQERAPAAIAGRSPKSLAQCTVAAGKAAKHHQGTTRNGPGHQTDGVSGSLWRTAANPQLGPWVPADVGLCTSAWAGRRQIDMGIKFSKDGALFLCRETKKAGTAWCGEETVERDVTEVYKVAVNWMGNCCSPCLAMWELRVTQRN